MHLPREDISAETNKKNLFPGTAFLSTWTNGNSEMSNGWMPQPFGAEAGLERLLPGLSANRNPATGFSRLHPSPRGRDWAAGGSSGGVAWDSRGGEAAVCPCRRGEVTPAEEEDEK